MQQTEYNKLVRDRIPEILTHAGHSYETATMNEHEYQQALREKLIEEALEAASADSQQIVAELADLYEVIDVLMNSNDINSEHVRAEQERRRQERGSFIQRIRLLRTIPPENTP